MIIFEVNINQEYLRCITNTSILKIINFIPIFSIIYLTLARLNYNYVD